MTIKILGFSGSLRHNSINKKLVKLALYKSEKYGATPIYVDLKPLNIPLYDGDLENKIGLPKGIQQLKKLMIESDGFIISSPEYNGSYSAVLKNSIDWLSRRQKNETVRLAFENKTAIIMSSSGNDSGGIRAIESFEKVLKKLRVKVITNYFCLPRASENHFIDDHLVNKEYEESIENIVRQLIFEIKNK